MEFGHLIEGIVEQDPMTDRFVIRTTDAHGKPVTFDPEKAFAALKGKEVRFTLASFQELNHLAQLLEQQQGDEGVTPFYAPKKS